MFNSDNVTLYHKVDDEQGVNFDVQDDGNLWCTHGGWEGRPSFTEDGKIELLVLATDRKVIFDRFVET